MTEHELLQQITRRTLFKKVGYGLGNVALASLMADPALGMLLQKPRVKPGPLSPKHPQFPAKAKSIIYLFMAGAPSQLDLFEPKPVLNKFDGDVCPEEYIKGEHFAFIRGKPKLLGSPWKFAQHGQAGHQISELLPHLATVRFL